MEAEDNSILKTTQSTYTSSNTSTATGAIALISSNIQFQAMNSTSSPLLIRQSSSGENVWKKRNLENSVIIPQETQVKSKKKKFLLTIMIIFLFKDSSDLWSGVVSGKYRINGGINRQSSEMIHQQQENKNNKYLRSQTMTDILQDKRNSYPDIGDKSNNNFNGRIKRCLSGFGRGKMSLPDKNDIRVKPNQTNDKNPKPLFY